jgi:hypothetical protein
LKISSLLRDYVKRCMRIYVIGETHHTYLTIFLCVLRELCVEICFLF